MEIIKQIKAKNKAIKVINSCKTDEHFESSLNYIDLYYKKFEDFVGYNELKRLIKQLTESINKTDELLKEIENYNDGYIYRVGTHHYGSFNGVEYTNSFSAKEHMDEYNGDNGIVSLETNNKKFAKEVENHEGLNGHPVVIIELNINNDE